MTGPELDRELEWLRNLTAEIEAAVARWKPEWGDYKAYAKLDSEGEAA